MTTKRKEPERATGWTMIKDVIGSFIGVLPFVLILVGWGIRVESTNATRDKSIEYLQKEDERHEKDYDERKKEVDRRFDRIERRLDRAEGQSTARPNR